MSQCFTHLDWKASLQAFKSQQSRLRIKLHMTHMHTNGEKEEGEKDVYSPTE